MVGLLQIGAAHGRSRWTELPCWPPPDLDSGSAHAGNPSGGFCLPIWIGDVLTLTLVKRMSMPLPSPPRSSVVEGLFRASYLGEERPKDRATSTRTGLQRMNAQGRSTPGLS
jgi:hypothetical protein